MSRESKANLTFICSECADKRLEQFQRSLNGKSLGDFVGTYVKKGFPTKDDHKSEHMWVKVTGVNLQAGTLLGTLANDPMCDVGDLKCGDEVIVQRTEIEEVYKEKE